jgi:hypothetical protein
VINLPKVLAMWCIQVHYEGASQLVLGLCEVTCHLSLLASDDILGNLCEIWLGSGGGEHFLDVLGVHLFVELDSECSLTSTDHFLDQFSSRNLLLFLESESTVHFSLENVACHGDIGCAVTGLSHLHVLIVCDLPDLVVGGSGEPLANLDLRDIPFGTF